MQSKEDGDIIFIRLFPDEDLKEKLKEVCRLYNVKTAVVISGLGQLKKIKLGYFNEKSNYNSENFDAPHELLSLTGNICRQEGDYILHLHVVIGNEKKNTLGGHLIEGKVEVTNEVVLLKTDMNIKRKIEENTGLKGMFIQ